MYFRTSQFPLLKHRPRTEQQRIVSEAMKRHARAVGWRFWAALPVIVALALGLAYLGARYRLPQWTTALEAVLVGLIFYGYLLWEINGPVHRAVQAYLAKK
ncbi:MAG TPA: hypothetical protein VGN52_16920 [Burkholderiales bacterium]|jgi:CHASE2 domain-containing sensor protein